MKISVVRGSGIGKTQLSAFDAALKDAGVYNYNLITLSSIIPPGTTVVKIPRYKTPHQEYGHKLYVVKAERRSNEVGKYIAAGIGWFQTEGGKGVFVEHEIIGETDVAVESEIKLRIENSLRDLCEFRGFRYDEKHTRSSIQMTRITKNPTCVLILAVYQSEGWEK